MRRWLILLACFWFAMPASAQEDTSGYDEALRRIREAQETGATMLSFSHWGLTELPPEIGNLLHLQELRLDNNQLTHLPSEIGQLIRLETLYLNSNQLTSLPPEFFNLTNLRRLVLGSNQLTSLPPEIGQLTRLEALYLNSNQLTAVPSEIGRLTNLCWLNLAHNQLEELPFTMGSLRRLTAHECTSISDFMGLSLDNNPLVFPAGEIVEQGTPAILAFLRHPSPYPPYEFTLTIPAIIVLVIVGWFGAVGLLLRYLRAWRRA